MAVSFQRLPRYQALPLPVPSDPLPTDLRVTEPLPPQPIPRPYLLFRIASLAAPLTSPIATDLFSPIEVYLRCWSGGRKMSKMMKMQDLRFVCEGKTVGHPTL